MNKKILISCPISNREWILPTFLEHLLNLDYNNQLISLYFIVNNSKDSSYDILKEFKVQNQAKFRDIIIEVYNSKEKFVDDRVDVVRIKKTYHWLSELRNKILKKCYSGDYDYLLSCDSDILVRPDILNRLLSHKVDVVASLIFNGYLYQPPIKDYNPIENAYRFPNILRKEDDRYRHICTYKTKHPHKNDIGKLVEVDFTGAVFLASKEACKNTFYGWHEQGEDCVWSENLIKNGYKLHCDISCYSQHIMSEKLLQMYLNEELRFADGTSCKSYIETIDNK